MYSRWPIFCNLNTIWSLMEALIYCDRSAVLGGGNCDRDNISVFLCIKSEHILKIEKNKNGQIYLNTVDFQFYSHKEDGEKKSPSWIGSSPFTTSLCWLFSPIFFILSCLLNISYNRQQKRMGKSGPVLYSIILSSKRYLSYSYRNNLYM